ncbi:UNVERIFIED_ORG: hypothetical protein LHJ69_14170 [Shinella sp. XGS7]|nr:HI1506-related protein [Shinella sp. XGS7]
MATAKSTKTVPGLRVRSCSPQGVFRRAGFAFPREGIELPLSNLSKDQIKAIREEPMLLVEAIEIKAEPGEQEPAET